MSFYFPNVDPVYIYKREGTSDDPYLDLTQNLKIVNKRIVLREVPSYPHRVTIIMQDGTVLDEADINVSELRPNEFKVDYVQGVVFFHESLEDQEVVVDYLGTGYVNIPAHRVLLEHGIVADEETLQDFIDYAKDLLDESLESIGNSEEATRDAIEATQKALQAVQEAKDFVDANIRVNMPMVHDYEELLATYPDAENGWTVFVHTEGIRYRYDGFSEEWVAIDSVGGEFPLASETLDGMMSKEDYIKLKEFDDNSHVRVMTFVIPQELLLGVQHPHIIFPFEGEISTVNASVVRSGETETVVNIEKSTNYADWDRVTSSPVTILPHQNFDDKSYVLSENGVSKGDIFRLNIDKVSEDTTNLTLNIEVNIKNKQ